MKNKRFLGCAASAALFCVLAVGCSSASSKANDEATRAASSFNLGNFAQARKYIDSAVSLRDDVSDYWLLYARIAVRQADYGGAYRAYRNVLSLDRSNLEAMTSLCQLAINGGDVRDVEPYADQLLLLNPNDPVGLLTKGNIAMRTSKYTEAIALADKVLSANPKDLGAQVLKAQSLSRKGDLKQAGDALEASLKIGGDPASRLRALAGVRELLIDRPGYVDVIKRLALAVPQDSATQLEYADQLYQGSDPATAQSVILANMAQHGDDPETADDTLQLLLVQGAGALTSQTLVAQAQSLSLTMRAALARYALSIKRPDLAEALLGPGLAAAEAGDANLEAKVALAQVAAQRGHSEQAQAIITQVLGVDGALPSALVTRSRLELGAGKLDAAINDARRVVSDDAGNGDAALALVDALVAKKEPILALSALRDAADADPDDLRLTERLARMMLASGNRDGAGALLRARFNAAPVDLRVQRLRAVLCPQIGPSCGTEPHPNFIPGL